METLSTCLAHVRESTSHGGFLSHRCIPLIKHDDVIKWKNFPRYWPFVRGLDVFFDLRLNKRLSKQSSVWWFETLLHSLWRHRNEVSDSMLRCYLCCQPEQVVEQNVELSVIWYLYICYHQRFFTKQLANVRTRRRIAWHFLNNVLQLLGTTHQLLIMSQISIQFGRF